MSFTMTATAEEAVGVEEEETDTGMAVDATATVDRSAVPMKASISGRTAASCILAWTVRHVPKDTRKMRYLLTAKEVACATVLDGVGQQIMTLKVK